MSQDMWQDREKIPAEEDEAKERYGCGCGCFDNLLTSTRMAFALYSLVGNCTI